MLILAQGGRGQIAQRRQGPCPSDYGAPQMIWWARAGPRSYLRTCSSIWAVLRMSAAPPPMPKDQRSINPMPHARVIVAPKLLNLNP
jgi:hypothetical protein